MLMNYYSAVFLIFWLPCTNRFNIELVNPLTRHKSYHLNFMRIGCYLMLLHCLGYEPDVMSTKEQEETRMVDKPSSIQSDCNSDRDLKF